MIPWPIALIAGFHAALVALCFAAWAGAGATSIWPLLWAAASAVVMVGLGLMRPWARSLAVWVSVALMTVALAGALVSAIVTPPQPKASLLATGLAAIQVAIMRYLTQPRVKAWFASGERC